MSSEYAVVYQISSKLVHAFGFQTPITASSAPLPWQPHYGGHVENMMECDHPSCVTVSPLVGELWHFEYFPTWRPSAILNFKKLIFDYVTVIAVLTCCFVPNFIKIGSHVRPPDAHNCRMFNVGPGNTTDDRLLGPVTLNDLGHSTRGVDP